MPIADVSRRAWSDLASLKGRVIALTGAANGIGWQTAHRLIEAGANVVAGDRDADGLASLVSEIEGAGNRCRTLQIDTREPADHARLAALAVSDFGRLDGWINDAGAYPIKPAIEITPDEWRDLIAIDLSAYFFGAQAAARAMGDRGGVILNIASSLGYHGVPNQASYVSSKFGVRGLTAALAVEWSPKGIRVVAIGPGMIDTASMRAAAAMPVQTDPFETYAKNSLLGRAGVPDDIARVAAFLMSDAAAYVTGSTWLVDGGEVASGGMA